MDPLHTTLQELIKDRKIYVDEVDDVKKILETVGALDIDAAGAVVDKMKEQKKRNWSALGDAKAVKEELPLSSLTIPDEHKNAALLNGARYLDGSRPSLDFNYVLSKEEGERSNPFDFEYEHWQRVFKSNQLMSGIDLNLKIPRRSFKTALKMKSDSPPVFMLADGSEIDYSIVYSDVSQARMLSKFDKHQANISSPFVSASAEHLTRERKATLSTKRSVYKSGEWSFPRVILQLNHESVEATKEFKSSVEKALEKENDSDKFLSLQEVFRQYGHVWASEVTLGGQLYFTEEKHDEVNVDEREIEQEIKATITAKIKSISPSYARSKGEKNIQRDENAEGSGAQNWTATGGDTLLAGDAGQWTTTVGNYVNWRVIKLKDIQPLYEMIGLSPDQIKEIKALEKAYNVPDQLGWKEVEIGRDKEPLPPLQSVSAWSSDNTKILACIEKDAEFNAQGGQVWTLTNNSTWEKKEINAILKQVSIGKDGTMFAVNNAGDVYLFKANSTKWERLHNSSKTHKQVAAINVLEWWQIRNDAKVIANFSGKYSKYDGENDGVVDECDDPSKMRITVGWDGSVWVLANGKVYRTTIETTELSFDLKETPTGKEQLTFHAICARNEDEIWGIASGGSLAGNIKTQGEPEEDQWCYAVKWLVKQNELTVIGSQTFRLDEVKNTVGGVLDITVDEDGEGWMIAGRKLFQSCVFKGGYTQDSAD